MKAGRPTFPLIKNSKRLWYSVGKKLIGVIPYYKLSLVPFCFLDDKHPCHFYKSYPQLPVWPLGNKNLVVLMGC